MEPPDSPRLLARVRDKIRLKHYSIRTEQAYVDWIRRFVWFHGKRHPGELGAAEVEAFLTDLAVARKVAASTQNQAKSALLFLYKEVLGVELPWLEHIDKARPSARLPVVLTRDEVDRVLAELEDVHALIGCLLYGTGMRVMEAMRLRVKDVDFARREILVRDGKGMKDRVTVLPRAIVAPMRGQLEVARELHRNDLALGFGVVWLPFALARKYRTRRAIGDGSTFSPRPVARATREAALFAGITSRTKPFSGRCGKPFATQASPNPRHRTRCVTRSPPTSSNPATISAPSRNYSATATSPRP